MTKSHTQEPSTAELMALIASMREELATLKATPKPRASKASKASEPKADMPEKFRIVKAGKGCELRTPLGAEHGLMTTFAIWLDGDAKRRAYVKGNTLLVDSRGIKPAQVLVLANMWHEGKKTKRELTGEQRREDMPSLAVVCYEFTKAGK